MAFSTLCLATRIQFLPLPLQANDTSMEDTSWCCGVGSGPRTCTFCQTKVPSHLKPFASSRILAFPTILAEGRALYFRLQSVYRWAARLCTRSGVTCNFKISRYYLPTAVLLRSVDKINDNPEKMWIQLGRHEKHAAIEFQAARLVSY